MKLSSKAFNRLKSKTLLEKEIQQQFVAIFSLKYPNEILLSIPNEAAYKRRDLLKMGVRSGTMDMLLARPTSDYGGLWIEFKAGKNKLSLNQEKFKKSVEAAGYQTVVCYSCDSAMFAAKEYLGY